VALEVEKASASRPRQSTRRYSSEAFDGVDSRQPRRIEEDFSSDDEGQAEGLHIPSYLGTPSGAIKKYQPPVSKLALAGKSVGVTTLVLGNGTCPIGGSLE
jgi:hypothetical protein